MIVKGFLDAFYGFTLMRQGLMNLALTGLNAMDESIPSKICSLDVID